MLYNLFIILNDSLKKGNILSFGWFYETRSKNKMNLGWDCTEIKINIELNATLKPERLLGLGSALKHFLEHPFSCSEYDIYGPYFNFS